MEYFRSTAQLGWSGRNPRGREGKSKCQGPVKCSNEHYLILVQGTDRTHLRRHHWPDGRSGTGHPGQKAAGKDVLRVFLHSYKYYAEPPRRVEPPNGAWTGLAAYGLTRRFFRRLLVLPPALARVIREPPQSRRPPLVFRARAAARRLASQLSPPVAAFVA